MDEEKARFLIVDGHSMVFSWPDLEGMHRANPRKAREELVRRLTGYQDFSGERVVLVFDGRGEDVGKERLEDGIQVFYSRAEMSADAIIERLAVKYAGDHEITVASRDRGVLDGAAAAGAQAISAQGLQDLVERAEADLRRRLAGRR